MTIVGITCQRDDGPYMAEWIAHHLAVGFDRMLVLSHDCSDGSDALLEALSADERITHLPFEPHGKKAVQWQALNIARKHPWTEAADWVLFFDCDEFICLPEGNLPSLLKSLEAEQGHFDALALPWLFFGSAGLQNREPGLTPERLTMAAPDDLHFPMAHLFKTIFRPQAFRRMGVHRPRAKPHKPARWLAPDGRPLPEHFATNDLAISLYGRPTTTRRIWLNHYSLRSAGEFILKRDRGLPNHSNREIDLTYWAERNWNTEVNRKILTMMDATHTELDKLMALPRVAEHLTHCEKWHETRTAELMMDMDTRKLHFRIGMLTGSTPPSAALTRAFVQAHRRIAAQGRNTP